MAAHRTNVGGKKSPSGPGGAPPGLKAPGFEDSLNPVKVKLGNSFSAVPPSPYLFGSESMVSPPSVGMQDSHALNYMQPIGMSGEWVNAVVAAAPYLNAQGLQQALGILDRAINNIQKVKALDGIVADALSRQARGAPPSQHLHAAELMRQQVWEQQQLLLRELHSLHNIHAIAGAGARLLACAPQGLDSLANYETIVQARAASASSTTELVLKALTATHLPPPEQGLGGECIGVPVECSPGQVAAGRPCPRPFARAPQQEALKASGMEKPQRASGRQVQTLSTSLQLLSHEDPNRLFIVRRINKLGFKASRKLKVHFSAYGTVVRVLVAHSTVRQHGDPQSHARRRPSSLGFVHMASAEAVLKVLAGGEDQEVDGSFIRVQRFERQTVEATNDDEAEGEDQDIESIEKDNKWERQQTGSSGVSTSASTMMSGESEA